MAALLNNIGSIVQAGVQWMSYVVQAIGQEGNEVLMLFTTFGFIGTGIGMFNRLRG